MTNKFNNSDDLNQEDSSNLNTEQDTVKDDLNNQDFSDQETVKVEEEKADNLTKEENKNFLNYSIGNYQNTVTKEIPELLEALKSGEFPVEALPQLQKEMAAFTKSFYENVCISLTQGNEQLLARIQAFRNSLQELPKQLERAKRDADIAAQFANEKLVKGPIKNLIETFKLSLDRIPKDSEDENFKGFVEEVFSYDHKYRTELAKHDVIIFGKPGDKFDPNFHDAVSFFPAPTEEQKGTLAYVSAEGFKIKDRVVVPAKVVVFLED